MNDVELFLFIGGFFGIFIVLGIVMLIKYPKRISSYSLEKASQKVQLENRDWIGTLIVIVVVDVIAWFWLGQKVPLHFFWQYYSALT